MFWSLLEALGRGGLSRMKRARVLNMLFTVGQFDGRVAIINNTIQCMSYGVASSGCLSRDNGGPLLALAMAAGMRPSASSYRAVSLPEIQRHANQKGITLSLDYQHAVPVAVEPVGLPHSLSIGRQCQFAPSKGADQHQ